MNKEVIDKQRLIMKTIIHSIYIPRVIPIFHYLKKVKTTKRYKDKKKELTQISVIYKVKKMRTARKKGSKRSWHNSSKGCAIARELPEYHILTKGVCISKKKRAKDHGTIQYTGTTLAIGNEWLL